MLVSRITPAPANRCRLFAITLTLCTALAPAQWSADPAINTPVCVNDNSQILPHLISDAAGGSIIVWQDFRQTNPKIYAQRLDPNGIPLWPLNGVQVAVAPQSQTSPQVISDANGGCIIAWIDGRTSSMGDVYAQRLSPTGTPLWPTAGVPVCTASDQQIAINIETDGAGGAILTWNDVRSGIFGSYAIYAQRLNPEGAAQWALDGIVVAPGNGLQNDAHLLLTDSTGGVFIAWNSRASAVADIRAQRLNSAGAKQWLDSGVPVCTAAGDQVIQSPTSICTDNAGGIILGWNDSRNGVTQLIYAQRLSSTGSPQWSADGIPVCTAIDEQRLSSFVADGQGGAIVGINSGPIGTRHILAQRLSAAGAPQWTTGGVTVCSATGDRVTRPMVTDGTGGAILSWIDARSDNLQFDIYTQRVNSAGQLQWAAQGQPLATASGDQFPALVSSIMPTSNSGAVLAWQDTRSAGGIYATRLNSDGTLGNLSSISTWTLYP